MIDLINDLVQLVYIKNLNKAMLRLIVSSSPTSCLGRLAARQHPLYDPIQWMPSLHTNDGSVLSLTLGMAQNYHCDYCAGVCC